MFHILESYLTTTVANMSISWIWEDRSFKTLGVQQPDFSLIVEIRTSEWWLELRGHFMCWLKHDLFEH